MSEKAANSRVASAMIFPKRWKSGVYLEFNRECAQVRVQECGHARWGGIGIPAIRRRRPGPRGRFFTFGSCHDPVMILSWSFNLYSPKYWGESTFSRFSNREWEKRQHNRDGWGRCWRKWLFSVREMRFALTVFLNRHVEFENRSLVDFQIGNER